MQKQERREFLKNSLKLGAVASATLVGAKCLLADEQGVSKKASKSKKNGSSKMRRNVKITILRSEVYKDIAEKYAIPNFQPCPFHKAGDVFISDGENKPEGLCEYAWKPMEEMVKMLSRGELLQPKGTWMADDDKGIFACVDGIRPVIMLIEAQEKNA